MSRYGFRKTFSALTIGFIALVVTFLWVASYRAHATSQPAFQFPASVQQGSLVIGRVAPGIQDVRYNGQSLRISPEGWVVMGVGRNATQSVVIDVITRSGQLGQAHIEVTPRDWPIEQVNGVPSKTVAPPPAIAERIKREQAAVTTARLRDDARTDFVKPFIWPVEGRISGRFGNQRIYNGTPGTPHSGMDIAAVKGTPVKAPAAGLVTFANASLYLTGGTLIIDHGQGVSSNFLHLSRIDVCPGQYVQQGQIIGAVGATGRATGPHLHWGMNWFDVRVDPLLVLDATKAMPQ